MADELVVRPHVSLSPDDLQWRFSRASGPGGQGVEHHRQPGAAVLRPADCYPSRTGAERVRTWRTGSVDDVITVVAAERRSQFQNRAAATARLLDVLRAATAPRHRAGADPADPKRGGTPAVDQAPARRGQAPAPPRPPGSRVTGSRRPRTARPPGAAGGLVRPAAARTSRRRRSA